MKIRLTYTFKRYESKLATFISICKGSVAGFLAWLGCWMLPFIIAMGTTGGNAVLAIIMGVVIIGGYIALFFIPEYKIDERRKQRLIQKIEKRNRKLYSKYFGSKN